MKKEFKKRILALLEKANVKKHKDTIAFLFGLKIKDGKYFMKDNNMELSQTQSWFEVEINDKGFISPKQEVDEDWRDIASRCGCSIL